MVFFVLIGLGSMIRRRNVQPLWSLEQDFIGVSEIFDVLKAFL